MEISVKYPTSIWFVQVWVVFDSDTNQIYEGCQYGFTPLNLTEDKSDWTFEKEIIDYGYELRRTIFWTYCGEYLFYSYFSGCSLFLWIMISIKFWIQWYIVCFWNFNFWPYGRLAQISAILIFWWLQKLYVH